jgi:hypothetical protein
MKTGVKMTPSKNYKPFMTYLSPKEYIDLKRFSKANKVAMSQLVREGVAARLSMENPYSTGFNDGLKKAVEITKGLKASEMRFPSGKSFGELIEEAVIGQFIVEAKHEANRTTEPVPVV